jgi:ParB family chromosome partitioning protein
MAKFDDMMRGAGSNIAESMGATRLNGAPSTSAASPAVTGVPARLQGISKSKNAAEIPVEKIAPDPDQPREEFDENALGRLADSLRTRGQLQPIRVRWDEGKGVYVVLVGERRWRAARMAGLSTLSAIVVDGPIAPGELLAIQLIENCLREDLRPIEQARAFRSLIDRNGWTVRQVAQELAIDHSNVVRALALLELPSPVQEQVEQGTLPPSTAYEIAKIADPAEQAELAERVVTEGLTRAETAAAVTAKRANKASGAKGRGRGKGKAHKVTSRVFRTKAGARFTIECSKGLDDDMILAGLAEITVQLNATRSTDDQAAA